MALIECYECNEYISESARKCPHCGANPDDEPTDIRVWISLILGAFIFYQIEFNIGVEGIFNHIILFFLFLVGFPVGTIIYLSFKETNNSSESSTKSKPNKSIPNSYKNKVLYLDVVGVFAERSRKNQFKLLDNNSILYLEPEPNNRYDKNAIKGLNYDTKKQNGYLEKGQSKLLNTLQSNENYFISVSSKEQYYSESKQDEVFKLSINIFIGFETEMLNKIREIINLQTTILDNIDIKDFKFFINNSDLLIEKFVILMQEKEILKLYKKNELGFNLIIDNITINTIKGKEFEKALMYYEKVKGLIDPSIALVKRIEKSKLKIK